MTHARGSILPSPARQPIGPTRVNTHTTVPPLRDKTGAGSSAKIHRSCLQRYAPYHICNYVHAMRSTVGSIGAIGILLMGSASAFGSGRKNGRQRGLGWFSPDKIAGVVPPTGFWDPCGFCDKADEATIKRYREAEITHGRVAMLASVGFIAGENIADTSYSLFGTRVTGPAITHFDQIPEQFWYTLLFFIGVLELNRANNGWLDPDFIPVDKPGLLRRNYIPGDLGFDPLGLMPVREDDLLTMQTKELQNGRLAMLAVAGFVAQELVDGRGIFEHLEYTGYIQSSVGYTKYY